MKTPEDEMICGGWKMLCASVMAEAVSCLRWRSKAEGGFSIEESQIHSDDARSWLRGGIGAITFEDCCESLGVDPARARRMIEQRVA